MAAPLLTISAVLTISTFVASIAYVFIALRNAVALLITNGYAAYLGLTDPATNLFVSLCARDTVCRENLSAAWQHYYPTWVPMLFIASLLLLIVAFVTFQRSRHPHIDLATGRWSTKQDLKRAGYLENPKDPNQRGYVGLHPSGKTIRVPEHIRFSHTLVLGGPGARKSTGYHWQNILSDANDGWSVIILDLKYPDPKGGFCSVIPYFKERGYNIFTFTPYDSVTHRLPIIQDATNERIAREISEMIIPPGEDGNAAFYRNNERRILAGLIMHAADNGLSITDLHTVCQQGASGVRAFVNGKNVHDGKPSALYQPASIKASTLIQILFDAEPKDQTGWLSAIEGKLQFFADERLGNATRMGTDNWAQIDLNRIGTEKTLLYVGLPQKNIDSGSGKLLLQLIKRLVDSALSETAYAHQGSVPVPVSFYLDEFPSLGKLPNVESNFATMRSRRVAYHLTIQNISQGKAIYGTDAFKSFFTSNFQTIMLFPSFIKFEDAKYISQILGDTMTTVEGHGNTRGGEYRSLSENWRESTRPLVTIDEMQTWPSDEAIVILNGVPHTRVLVPGIWEDRVRGRRNPFKPIYDQLDHHFDAQAYVERLLRESRLAYQRTKMADLRRAAEAALKSTTIAATSTYYQPAPGITLAAPNTPEPDPSTPTTTTPPTPEPSTSSTRPSSDPPTTTATSDSDASAAQPAPSSAPATVNAKRVLTKLVQSISAARSSVRVVGDRAQGHVRAVHIPLQLLREHVSDDIVQALVREKVLVLGTEHVQVQPHALKELDTQWYRYLVNQLPSAHGKVPHEIAAEARAAVETAVREILDEDLRVTIRVNGRTKRIERVEFSVWGIRTELLHEHQVAWKNARLLAIKDGVAIVKPHGIAALSDATTQRLHALYLIQSGRADDGAASVTNDAASASAEQGTAGAPVIETPPWAPPAAEALADDPILAAPRAQPIPTMSTSARAAPFRAPPTTARDTPTEPSAAQDLPAATTPDPRQDSTPSTPERKDAPAVTPPKAPRVNTKRAPALTTPTATAAAAVVTPVASPRRPRRPRQATNLAPEANSTSTPTPTSESSESSESSDAPEVRVTHLPQRGLDAITVMEGTDLAERTRAWFRDNTAQVMVVANALNLTSSERKRLATHGARAFAEPQRLLISSRAAKTLGAPKVPPSVPCVPAKINGVTTPAAYVISLTDAPRSWGAWIAKTATRISGHPRCDMSDPLQGVEYHPKLLYVPVGDAERLLGAAVDARFVVTAEPGPLAVFDINALAPAVPKPALATP